MKKADPNPHANRNIMVITYVVLAVFVGMIGYFSYFLQTDSKEVVNNPYNARLDRFSDRVVRGEILSSDGQVLAGTVTGEDGEEIRIYPFGNLFAHAVGYSTRGKTGLESQGNFYLLTSHVNPLEYMVNEISDRKNPGDSIVTSLDVGLQLTAYQALGDRKGAVVAIEPDTGKILAMVSKPDYDPNPASLDGAWEGLVDSGNTQAQLLNRATQGLYPPGSVFKIITALEALREDSDRFQNYHFDCSGVFEQSGYSIRCYQSTAHGSQDMGQAFANSCNGAFADLGLELDLDAMYSLAGQLLFNSELPLPMIYSQSTYHMQGGEERRKLLENALFGFRMNLDSINHPAGRFLLPIGSLLAVTDSLQEGQTEGADEWEILQTAIGQGRTLVTPVHMAMITAAIANGGILMKPYLMDHIQNASGEEVSRFLPEVYKSLMTAEETSRLNELMVQVVTEGTGSALRDAPYQAAGKTGSAEFEQGKETHAWFTGYAPAEDPKIVVTVLIEEGGSGGRAAAPVARAMFDAYLLR